MRNEKYGGRSSSSNGPHNTRSLVALPPASKSEASSPDALKTLFSLGGYPKVEITHSWGKGGMQRVELKKH